MQKDVQEKYSQTTGSIPVRTDIDMSGPAWTDGQRGAAAAPGRGVQEQARAAQPRAQHGAAEQRSRPRMIDVITEYIHNDKVTPEQAVTRLHDAVESARG